MIIDYFKGLIKWCYSVPMFPLARKGKLLSFLPPFVVT